MPAAWIGAGAAIIGAGSSIANSPSTTGGGPNYYTPTGLSSADQAWQSLLTGQTGAQGGIQALLPYYQQSLEQGLQFNDSYAPGYANAASQAAQYYGGLGSTLAQQASQNFGTQQSLLGAGQQVYNLGLDPQNALYNRTAQQLQDQTGATNSMYGLGSSAAGAGVANQAMSNFNIDWQNNQLSRALQGLQGYTGAATTAGQYGQFATSQAGLVPQYLLQAGQLPYQTAQTIAGVPGQLASQYASGVESGPLSSAASIQGQIIPYLNYGTGAQSVPFQTQAQAAGSLGSTVAGALGGLGSTVQNNGGFAGLFGNGTTGSYGNGDFSGAFTSSPYYSGGGNGYGFTT